MLEFGRDACGDLNLAVSKEWLETNGLGGYACGTMAGLNTRGYHSLLTVPLKPPLKRTILLSQLDEVVVYKDKKYMLSTMEYESGALNPRGYIYLERFKGEPFPTFYYRLDDQVLQKQIFMSYGQSLTWITYQLLTEPDGAFNLMVKPLLSFRSHHLMKQGRLFVNTYHDLDRHVVKILPDQQVPSMFIHHTAEGYEHSAHWFNRVFYRAEKNRGLDCVEDLYTPGVLDFELKKGAWNYMAVTTESLEQLDVLAAMKKETSRRKELQDLLPLEDEFGRRLLRAADHFLVKRGEGMSVISGYPWLAESGRDAMVASMGLAVASRRYEDARRLLKTYAAYCDQGMLPNHFSEEMAEPVYNAADAALWFIIAVDYYHTHTRDDRFVKDNCWPVMENIIAAYSTGTRYGIRMDTDGLINLPEEGAQLTWMDAQVGDWVATPRAGKPVDVNALWYNCLCMMADYAEKFSRPAEKERYARLAANAREGFRSLFWNEEGGYLYDRVEDFHKDFSFRPNQLWALALPYPLLEGQQAQRLLQQVMERLYTTFGCRTLDRSDDHYRGFYKGDLMTRESAAFQGTVWPWMIGALAGAWRAAYGASAETDAIIGRLLKPFELHLTHSGLGLISEMFDGEEPHRARGCIARAWNVAELLRVYLETNYKDLK